MSEEKKIKTEGTEAHGLGKCPPIPPLPPIDKAKPIDLCVQVAYARFIKDFFSVFKFIEIPSAICRCECENVEVTDRTVTFTCDSVIICIEFIICLKFFPLTGNPYCQTFPACFRRTIPFFKFNHFPKGYSISLEEFQQAEGVCLEVDFIDCFCNAFPFDCTTFIYVNLFFNLRVKLFQERNVIVRGDFFGGPVVKLPKKVDPCGPHRFVYGSQEDDDPAGEDNFKESLDKLPLEAKEEYQQKLMDYMKKIRQEK